MYHVTINGTKVSSFDSLSESLHFALALHESANLYHSVIVLDEESAICTLVNESKRQ